MQATSLQAWDRQFEGYDSNEEYAGEEDNAALIVDHDSEAWEEVLAALYKFKLDVAKYGSAKS